MKMRAEEAAGNKLHSKDIEWLPIGHDEISRLRHDDTAVQIRKFAVKHSMLDLPFPVENAATIYCHCGCSC
jgi:hypothetical protein